MQDLLAAGSQDGGADAETAYTGRLPKGKGKLKGGSPESGMKLLPVASSR